MADKTLDVSIQTIKGIGPKKSAAFARLGVETLEDALSYYPREYEERGKAIPVSTIQEGMVSLCLEWKGSPRINRMRKGFNTTLLKGLDQTGEVDCVWFNQPFRGKLYKTGSKYYVLGKAVKRNGGYQIQNPVVEEYDEEVHCQFRRLPVYPLTKGLTQKEVRYLLSEAVSRLDNYDAGEDKAQENKDLKVKSHANKDDANKVDASKAHAQKSHIDKSHSDKAHESNVRAGINDAHEDKGWYYLDDYIVAEYGFISKIRAWKNIHFPESEEDLLQAKRRLAFEEFLQLQISIEYMKKQTQSKGTEIAITDSPEIRHTFLERLPFSLTSAQNKVLNEVLADMAGGNVMNRLIQGDVGSGKTVIAAAALYSAAKAGYQGAMMAPTEILARQHYDSLKKILEDNTDHHSGLTLGLLTGSMKASEKEEVKEGLRDGRISIVLGTHAVIQEDVEFHKLGLVITDEQHRFGVRQRSLLQSKGENSHSIPHMLVMSATPIPRTLAHILHGDLELSTIDTLPPGRIPIKTFHVNSAYRERIYGFVRKHALEGSQTYIVCPLVEDSEEMDLRSAEEVYKELKEGPLKGIPVGLLHGRQKPAEKDEIMQSFAAGRVQVLISTTVIEVGINVPNAIIMIVENAERFGLAQLHQLRGRVGRGVKPSWCILISDESDGKTKQRMDVLVKSTDGFEIAEKDLELRGPGELYGLRQHGIPNFQFANPLRDHELFELSKRAAERIIASLDTEQSRSILYAVIEQRNKAQAALSVN